LVPPAAVAARLLRLQVCDQRSVARPAVEQASERVHTRSAVVERWAAGIVQQTDQAVVSRFIADRVAGRLPHDLAVMFAQAPAIRGEISTRRRVDPCHLSVLLSPFLFPPAGLVPRLLRSQAMLRRVL